MKMKVGALILPPISVWTKPLPRTPPTAKRRPHPLTPPTTKRRPHPPTPPTTTKPQPTEKPTLQLRKRERQKQELKQQQLLQDMNRSSWNQDSPRCRRKRQRMERLLRNPGADAQNSSKQRQRVKLIIPQINIAVMCSCVQV